LVLSAIGIVVVPFVFCAMVAAFLFGKVAVYRYTGQQIGIHTHLVALQQPLLALVVGVVLCCLLYTVPVLGFLVWGVILPVAVGAAVLAFFRSFRSESAGVVSPSAPPIAVASQMPGPAPGQAAVPPLLLARVGFWRRFFATVLDFILFGTFLRLFNHHPQGFILLWTAYHVAFWSWKGTTIGGIVLGIKIVQADGSPINFPVALVRAVASFLSAAALFLGFFWAGWSREQLSWHDKIAGTIVVRSPKGLPLL
jgi:uncharacterized RDD family membrane protein YckC